jgi:hypothetical protein
MVFLQRRAGVACRGDLANRAGGQVPRRGDHATGARRQGVLLHLDFLSGLVLVWPARYGPAQAGP